VWAPTTTRHWDAGANDNGTGVALLLRWPRLEDAPVPRTIRYLRCSTRNPHTTSPRTWAAAARTRARSRGENIVAMISRRPLLLLDGPERSLPFPFGFFYPHTKLPHVVGNLRSRPYTKNRRKVKAACQQRE